MHTRLAAAHVPVHGEISWCKATAPAPANRTQGCLLTSHGAGRHVSYMPLHFLLRLRKRVMGYHDAASVLTLPGGPASPCQREGLGPSAAARVLVNSRTLSGTIQAQVLDAGCPCSHTLCHFTYAAHAMYLISSKTSRSQDSARRHGTRRHHRFITSFLVPDHAYTLNAKPPVHLPFAFPSPPPSRPRQPPLPSRPPRLLLRGLRSVPCHG